MTIESKQPFLWGAASSAFQIEGGIENDMTAWEQAGRFRTASLDPRVGIAVDHWNRWRDDFGLLKSLGLNSYRFSVEWARLEPEPGRFNEAAFDQYSRMIDHLLELGISPMLTLHHFTHPAWFHEYSPWHSVTSQDTFVRFAERVCTRLLDRVSHVVTFNEPLVWLLAGYGDAKFPPGERDLRKLMHGLRNMLLAHRQVFDMIKERYPSTQVGIAHNMIAFRAARKGNLFDSEMKRRLHRFYNLLIPKAFVTNRLNYSLPLILNYDEPVSLDNRIDFWGVNYYYRMHVRFRLRPFRPFDMLFVPRSKHGLSDLGWEIYPRGLYKCCRWLRFTEKPLIITENGIATDDDSVRVRFLERHLSFLERLRGEGMDIRGYYYWSLMDNYEWLIGKSARFGLFQVDYENGLERTLRPSGEYFANHIASSSYADIDTHQELSDI
ncbi:MAG: glycoside hydrolase family 1 protein [bacterium]|nr:glycoside hydrolase family 1 protein [bacterium]